MILKNKIYYIVLLFTLVCCSDNHVFDSDITFTKQGWLHDDMVRFEAEITDTISKNDIFINIRNNNNFSYSNLFLITEIEFPDGLKTVDTLEYAMAKPSGEWLGRGGEVKDNKLLYKENVRFPGKGIYKIKLKYAMRKIDKESVLEKLEGVVSVGISIEVKKQR
ncbi:MAG: gliding motility lipoprotein GldH [Flavobacteriaceae bacterium]|nr:gliding motility lipoprotein GldH [Flavobacteriaceae bacterium]